jgi:Spy/CpxP family protein refolding chaperone
MRTGTWKAVGVLALAAVAGGVVGSAVTVGLGRGGREGHGHGSGWYIDLLDRELQLTAAQRDSVRAILDRRQGSMDSILAEMRPRIEAARAVIRHEISGQLTPEQQKMYVDLTARLDAERRDKNQRESKRQ